MKYQSLNDDWVVRQAGTSDWIPAIVPGNVHLDLLAAGLIPDPFVVDNEHQVQWVAESDWEYKLNFAPNKELLSHEHIFLVADGVDTIAEVKLNGVHLGYCDNMFCTYRWELGSTLEQGENELIFNFSSPEKYISERQALRPMQGVTHAIDGAPHIRKAPCHFGWDWVPKLPSIGIWKDIRLEDLASELGQPVERLLL